MGRKESNNSIDFDMLVNNKKSTDKLHEKSGPSFAGGILNINSKMKKDPNEE